MVQVFAFLEDIDRARNTRQIAETELTHPTQVEVAGGVDQLIKYLDEFPFQSSASVQRLAPHQQHQYGFTTSTAIEGSSDRVALYKIETKLAAVSLVSQQRSTYCTQFARPDSSTHPLWAKVLRVGLCFTAFSQASRWTESIFSSHLLFFRVLATLHFLCLHPSFPLLTTCHGCFSSGQVHDRHAALQAQAPNPQIKP
jgi:hypothetical protein